MELIWPVLFIGQHYFLLDEILAWSGVALVLSIILVRIGRKLAATLILLLFLTGCQSYLALIEGLNERQVQSCLDYNGAARLGAGIGSGSGALRGITATGGATLEICRKLLR